MSDRDWWCEDMEHNARIVTADTPDDAVEWFVRAFEREEGELTTVQERTTYRDDGTVQTHWYAVYDREAELVNHFMVKPWNDDAQDSTGGTT